MTLIRGIIRASDGGGTSIRGIERCEEYGDDRTLSHGGSVNPLEWSLKIYSVILLVNIKILDGIV